jgi:hypothetical protein
MFEFFTRPPKKSPVGSYRLDVVSLPEECDWEQYLPLEIRYIFKKDPAYKDKMRAILSQGKAIGVRTVLRTPENILKAVHTVSVHSQANYIITWLPALLRDKHLPKLTPDDHQRASAHGENLDQAVETIARDRLRFKRLVLIDEENIGIKPEEQRLMTELSEIIYPLAIDYAVFRVIVDDARERTKIAQAIIKALLIIGPVAHVLEKFSAGIGKVFAASADDLLGESAELIEDLNEGQIDRPGPVHLRWRTLRDDQDAAWILVSHRPHERESDLRWRVEARLVHEGDRCWLSLRLTLQPVGLRMVPVHLGAGPPKTIELLLRQIEAISRSRFLTPASLV